MAVVKKGSKWCVVYSGKGTPLGKIIKCYSTKRFGSTGAHNRALKMSAAIIISKQKAAASK